MLKKAKDQIQHLSDKDLVDRYRHSHDLVYVGFLYKRYAALVFAVCLKYLQNQTDAQDASMEIFEKIITDLKKHQVINFKSWLHVTAKNYCLMQHRKKATKRKKSDDFEQSSMAVVKNEEDLHHIDELLAKEVKLDSLNLNLAKLKDEQRICLELFYLKNYSYNQLVDETGFTIKQVKSYIQNGKRNLKILMEKDNNLEQKKLFEE